MPSIHEQLSEQFGALHRRLKGWQVFPEPVTPEPPFQPFTGYALAPVVDDGRVPTVGSSLLAGLSRWLGAKPPPEPERRVQEEEPEPTPLVRTDLIELQTSLPANLNLPREAFEAFLSQLAACGEPLSFELVGQPEQIHAQFVLSPSDVPLVRRQLNAYFPEAVFSPTQGTLEPFTRDDRHHAIVEFGLARECLFPLASGGKLDPFIGLIGALGELREDERAVYQVLFQPCRHRWADRLLRSVTDPEGRSLFVNRPEFAGLAREKVVQPLYAAVVRLAATSDTFEGAWEIVRNLAGALRVFARTDGNELIPLHNEDYPYEVHGEDVVRRQTRRSGMLLSTEELIGFVHLPGASIRAAKFRRQATNTKPAPRTVTGSQGIALGENTHAGETRTVRLTADQRTRHLHVIGASGTGKSTFLESLLSQDLAAGEGFALFDPHGDLVDKVLGRIPEHRIKDVILVDPSDETASIGFNILSAHSDLEKTLLASDLVSVFARLSTSWGDQMEGVLRNAILAFLESSQGGTLADLRRFLLDPKYRERFLATVQDPDIQFYWRKGFAQLTGNKSIGPVLTRLETFLSPKPLRYMVAQPVNRLDFADILDSGKIFLAKLSQGAIGKENAYLLGSLLMAKFQQTAMARQRQAAPLRRDFFIYLDEFQNFITPSLAEILSGARKYRLGLVLAHQELRQLERDREVASAVLSNPYTRVVFRVGDDDARKLESGFSSFTARDLQNLGTGEAVVRIERSDCDFNLSVPLPEEPDPDQAQSRRTEVTTASRARYATPRAEIEAALRKQFEVEESEPPKPVSMRHVAEPPPIPKATEVPKERVSEKEPPASAPPTQPSVAPSADTAAEVPGETFAAPRNPLETEHSSIKREITKQAEALGYVVADEEIVPGSLGRADLVLRRGKRVIACEVSVTTNAEDEIGNLTKCVAGGYPQVVLVASSARKLVNIEQKFRKAVASDNLTNVSFYQPAEFLAQLRAWAATDPRDMATEKTAPRKQRINLDASKMTDTERGDRERAMLARLQQAMKAPPPE